MTDRPIRSIVFDIGNVVVRWSPLDIVRRTFGEDADHEAVARRVFQHELWYQLNRGEISEADAKPGLASELGLETPVVDALFEHTKTSQDLVPGTVDLLERLAAAGYPLYALTDNVREIVSYLLERYTFWQLFRGVVVSAEVGSTKADPAIFRHLAATYRLDPTETLFVDDYPRNIEVARAEGFQVLQFADAAQCERELRARGVLQRS